MKMLRGLLYERMLAEKAKPQFADSYESGKSAIDFGSPDPHLHDAALSARQGRAHRAQGRATSTAVLDGDLDSFIEAYLPELQRAEKKRRRAPRAERFEAGDPTGDGE